MNGMIIQLVGSAVAIAAMVALAAWAKIPRPSEPLDEESAIALLALDYPDHRIESLWIAADAAGAVARSGDQAIVVSRLGDSWVTRDLPWSKAVAAPIHGGQVRFRLADPSAPRLSLAVSGVNPWPPQEARDLAA
jgi:hypothetical protein